MSGRTNRATVHVALTGLTALLAGCAARSEQRGSSAAAGAGPAAMFRGGPAHDGRYPGPAIDGYGGLQWRFQTRGPVTATPTVAGDLVYVGSADGRLYALRRATGEPAWTFDARSAIASTAAVAEGKVFVAARDGRLYALDARTGAERWRASLGADRPLPWGHESGDFYVSSPAYAGGTLYVGGGDGNVYALAASDGAVRWRHATGGRVRSSPAVEGGLVVVGSADGVVYAADARTGAARWTFATLGASLESGSFGFDRRTVQASPAIVGDRVFVGARDGFVYALDRATGRLAWKFDHEISWVNSSPAVADGAVYVGTSDGWFVQALDAATGAERWRTSTASAVWGSPAVVDSFVYAGEAAGNVLALDARTGAERWRWRVGSRVFSSPVPAAGTLYFGADDGAVYALNAARGRPLRRAVFWDARVAKAARLPGHERIRAFFQDRGYAVLDADSLAAFLRARAADRSPSVVVFAMDYLPSGLGTRPSGLGEESLLRSYLEAGGKVLWLGVPPLLFPRDPSTGAQNLKDIDRGATLRLLGVDHARGNFDVRGATVTPAGERWGLSGWWTSNWGADPRTVTQALALDDEGQATAWVRSYGGPAGSGFVRIPAQTWGEAPAAANLLMLQVAAEYFPR
ncbi:MAG TPA: PQQ-binding-like beta-propeller repeat protein [Gemmatimonadaceae bacterium]|nr:PQQ-binding-like beta-propeller repeat protein [Gemmatimonadaceae bacterium]